MGVVLLEILYVILVVLCAGSIIICATFLFMKRLKKGEVNFASFKDWVKHILEAILGI
jgi:hypothetical protein